MTGHLDASAYARLDPSHLSAGDTAWMLVCAALVLLMTPALAFFYGGMVRAKHVLAMLVQNFTAMAIVSVTWVVVGFSIAFGGTGRFWGDLHFAGLHNMGDAVPVYGTAQTVPTAVLVAFQLTFAVITPALITGATADRWKFGAFAAFVATWSVVEYAPVAHWVWGGGWIAGLGTEDFAGGTVVHVNAGAAGLAMALVLGRRRGWPHEPMRGHNIPFVMLGAALLWFGWIGFNAGSAGAADGLAAAAWVNTNTAAAAALIGWIAVEKLRHRRCTALGAASGAVAGLVAITPCAGFVSPMGSLAIGLVAGAVCANAIRLKHRFGFDDSLDVVGVHLVGGWVGTLAIGFFSTAGVNPAAVDGLFYGGGSAGASLLLHQFEAALAVTVFSFVATVIVAKLVGLVLDHRVSADEELAGLDTSLHGESAYEYGPFGGGAFSASGAARKRVNA